MYVVRIAAYKSPISENNMCINVRTYIHMYAFIHMCKCSFVCTCTCMYAHMFMCIYVHMYVYIFIFTYKHTGTVSARHLDCSSSRMFEIRNVSDIRYMYLNIHDVHVYIHSIVLPSDASLFPQKSH